MPTTPPHSGQPWTPVEVTHLETLADEPILDPRPRSAAPAHAHGHAAGGAPNGSRTDADPPVALPSTAHARVHDRGPARPALSVLTPLQPAPLFVPTPKAAQRVLEFFTAQINNDHTRKAYLNATRRFAQWCDAHGLTELAGVQPFHVAAFIRDLQGHCSPPTVKQHLAALRMLFDWLVTGHVLDVNPAHAVRGPKYIIKKGKTPVLTAEEARELLDSIAVVKKTVRPDGTASEAPAPVGLRDRALIGMMVYTFARVGAVLQMQVKDYFVQGRRGWVRLHEKGGKEHEVPCHHNLEQFLEEYLGAAGLAADPDGPLFRTAAGKTGRLTRNPMWQQDAYRMIQRRTRAAGIKTKIGNHTFRATGITAYLKNHGKLETAQYIANHESPRATKLYDRRQDEISLDEVERIAS
jgi:site-specific recombinase XerD